METVISPPPIPILKQRFPGEALIKLRQNPLTVLQEMASLGDCSMLKLAYFKFFVLNHPALIKEVLVVQNDAFIKGRATRLLSVLLGNGLLTSENAFHRRQRKLVLPAFHHHKIKDYADTMAQSAGRFTETWVDGQSMAIGDEMMALTLDVVAQTLFGADVTNEVDEIGEALAEGQEVFKNVTNPFAELILKFPFPITKKINRVVARMNATIYRIIEEHRQNPESYTDLLSMLLAAQDEETGHSMTDEQVRDEAMTLFTAGHETTAVALMWTWFLLAKHPDIERRMYEEIARVLNGRMPTFDDISKLVYTKQVFSETLRLFPPAWAISRETIRDVNIGGYQIPKGATVDLSAYLLQRDARFWPDPETFDPERFSPGNRKSIDKFAYMPFSAGLRGCIGEQFAWTEGIILLASIAQSWKLELLSDASPQIRPIITLRPSQPIRMRALHRN